MQLEDPLLQTEQKLQFVQELDRVECQSAIRYGSVILEECRSIASASDAVAAILADAAIERGILRGKRIESLRERLNLLAKTGLVDESSIPTDSDIRNVLELLCSERVDLVGLDELSVVRGIVESLEFTVQGALGNWAPETCHLPGGRNAQVHYEIGCEPWIASRLQDFFGMTSTPSIADGRQLLVVHLLAPNQRAVQVTKDLAGFWERHYPGIRRELMRRYPKHQWPEDGRTACPPPMRTQRMSKDR